MAKKPKARTAIRKAKKEVLARKKYQQAEDAFDSEDYLEAHKAFSFVVKKCRGTEYADSAQARIDKMEADAEIASLLEEGQTRKDCLGWLSMARNYTKTGSKDKAREYYDRILKTYPDSEFAQTAKGERSRL